ncbi:MAG: hypothetical protein M3506_02110 [Chloroflexota bacterium]|nr:hypothetical protein [Chloroflexota bacterium]
MSNVNSEDTGGGSALSDPAEDGGASRVVEERQDIPGRGGWRIVGALIITVVLLTPLVWIVTELLQLTRVLGDSNVLWIYVAVLVLIVAVAVWFLFRLLRSSTQDSE